MSKWRVSKRTFTCRLMGIMLLLLILGGPSAFLVGRWGIQDFMFMILSIAAAFGFTLLIMLSIYLCSFTSKITNQRQEEAMAEEAENSENSEVLDFTMITDNISECMEGMDGEQIAFLYNQICSRKIKYNEDSLWEYSGEKD